MLDINKQLEHFEYNKFVKKMINDKIIELFQKIQLLTAEKKEVENIFTLLNKLYYFQIEMKIYLHGQLETYEAINHYNISLEEMTPLIIETLRTYNIIMDGNNIIFINQHPNKYLF